jgi:hypothetical protein
MVTLTPVELPRGAWRVRDGVQQPTGIHWIDSAVVNGVLSKQMATRLSIFGTATRGFPCPPEYVTEESLLKFSENLTLPAVVQSDEFAAEMSSIAFQIGVDCKILDKQSWRNNAHVSSTNSGSYEVSRSEGGRAAAIGISYDKWAQSVPTVDSECVGLLGNYTLKAGVERWKTVHIPPDDLFGREKAIFKSIEMEGLITDVYYGFDAHTGNQIVEAAADHLVTLGFLKRGSWQILRAPPVGVTAVGEPGGKSRIVTQDVWAWTIVLQPLGHVSGQLLGNHPFAAAGMKRAHQHFEWAKGFTHPVGVDESIDFPNLGLVTSDMSEATDHCDFKVSNSILKSYLRGSGLATSYMMTASDLLCSAVQLPDGTVSTRGILMGRPGTKIVLMLHNLCAEYYAYWC